jgi:hypothetical protein
MTCSGSAVSAVGDGVIAVVGDGGPHGDETYLKIAGKWAPVPDLLLEVGVSHG